MHGDRTSLLSFHKECGRMERGVQVQAVQAVQVAGWQTSEKVVG